MVPLGSHHPVCSPYCSIDQIGQRFRVIRLCASAWSWSSWARRTSRRVNAQGNRVLRLANFPLSGNRDKLLHSAGHLPAFKSCLDRNLACLCLSQRTTLTLGICSNIHSAVFDSPRITSKTCRSSGEACQSLSRLSDLEFPRSFSQ